MKTTRTTRKRLYTAVGDRRLAERSPRPVRPASAPLQVLASTHARRFRLEPEELIWKCDPGDLPFESTRDVAPLRGMLGQRQALRSLRLGLSVPSPGYNIFICGLHGAESTGDLSAFVRSLKLPRRCIPDRCYVQNFADPQRPKLLELPPGKGARLQKEIAAILKRIHKALEKQHERKWRSRARDVLSRFLPAVWKAFPEANVRAWLKEWKRSLLHNVHHALVEDYEVNHLKVQASSVVVERIPTPANLFGWIGRRPVGDQATAPHFTEIRGGSLLNADGGVLLVSAADFYATPNSWTLLKSCLKYGVLPIEETEGQAATRGSGLKPDPIRVSVKVVLIGDYTLYDELFEGDPDFREVFKVRVDFDTEVPLTSRVLRSEYPALIARLCKDNHLRPFSAGAVARVLEFAVRRAGRRGKVTTETWLVADLLREADYWAKSEGHSMVTAKDVQRAVTESNLRLNLVETKIAEMINDGTILITTSGSRVGQVNGLAIYDMGDYLFGKPSRITAETSYGQSGIINIERESGLSGRSHDKGVQILAGYLRSRFAQRRPLNLTASVCFEQSYSGVDGDSASATEIYAILSSLSGLPIRQDIAVTGSVNQKGDIQPIGGVNEKIEGFFDCIRAGRATGREGVIIPRKNVNDLMLRDDVVRAVRRGKFHIYAIDSVEHGFELLTGVRAGRKHPKGAYASGSAFALVDRRLEEISAGLRQYQNPEEP